MVHEATMICIDTSEWMRNGDYSPNRFQAQSEAVNLICGAKTQTNPENTVGILTMAGTGSSVLVTPTSDLGKILACMHDVSRQMGGEVNLAKGIQVAHLALKHRQNKKQQQRIIVFVGSPVRHEKKELELIGMKLKKNNVAVDIINFGQEDDGKTEKLEALLAAVNNNNTSHIVYVPPGPNALVDALLNTPIFTGDAEGGTVLAPAAAGSVSRFEFGVDPNLDPELALALRVSMEEERARQEAAAKRTADEASKQARDWEQQSCLQNEAMDEHQDGDSVLLQQALAMSMDDPSACRDLRDIDMGDASDTQLALALQLSMQDSTKDSASQNVMCESEMSKLLADQAFVSSIFASLPGVDTNDPSVKDVLDSMQDQSESQDKKDEDNAPDDGEK